MSSILLNITPEEHALYKAMAISRSMTVTKFIKSVLAKEAASVTRMPDGLMDLAKRLVTNKHRNHENG